MYELKVGDRIRDNDPRMGNRILTITDILDTKVRAEFRGRSVLILKRRIKADGNYRRSGFNLIPARG